MRAWRKEPSLIIVTTMQACPYNCVSSLHRVIGFLSVHCTEVAALMLPSLSIRVDVNEFEEAVEKKVSSFIVAVIWNDIGAVSNNGRHRSGLVVLLSSYG